MDCKKLKGEAKKKCLEKGINYSLLRMARNATNKYNGFDTKKPATKRDSTTYKRGYVLGRQKLKRSGESEYEKMGRWEGQNYKK